LNAKNTQRLLSELNTSVQNVYNLDFYIWPVKNGVKKLFCEALSKKTLSEALKESRFIGTASKIILAKFFTSLDFFGTFCIKTKSTISYGSRIVLKLCLFRAKLIIFHSF
jgi:hypothetical protein